MSSAQSVGEEQHARQPPLLRRLGRADETVHLIAQLRPTAVTPRRQSVVALLLQPLCDTLEPGIVPVRVLLAEASHSVGHWSMWSIVSVAGS